MGKITSIYLTDEESAELKKFCDENQCTQYSALKTALKELISKSLEKQEETIEETKEDETEKDEGTKKVGSPFKIILK